MLAHVGDLTFKIRSRAEGLVHRCESQGRRLRRDFEADRGSRALPRYWEFRQNPKLERHLRPVGRANSANRCPPWRPWHARRTPLTTFSRLKGSVTPLRFTTERTAVSTVVNRRPHSGHERRRLIAWPSSASRESTTRESGCRQNGQCIGVPSLSPKWPQLRFATDCKSSDDSQSRSTYSTRPPEVVGLSSGQLTRCERTALTLGTPPAWYGVGQRPEAGTISVCPTDSPELDIALRSMICSITEPTAWPGATLGSNITEGFTRGNANHFGRAVCRSYVTTRQSADPHQRQHCECGEYGAQEKPSSN